MSLRTRLAALTAIAAMAAGGMTATAAHATQNNGGGTKPKVQCNAGGGVMADPGDEMTTTVIIRDGRGRYRGKTTYTQICGEDGNWHPVAKISAGTTRGPGFQTTTTRTVVSR
jgi:hypothetical protein